MAAEVKVEDALALESAPTVLKLSTPAILAAEGEANDRLRQALLGPVEDPRRLAGRRYAIVATNGVEEIEIVAALNWLRARGAAVEVVAPPADVFPPAFGVQVPPATRTHILAVNLMVNAGWIAIDVPLADAKPEAYDGVIIPGGTWNPDTLRANPDVLAFVKAFDAAGKLVAAICHGPQVLINAGLLKGRRATAFPTMQVDVANAGAELVDEPAVVDGNLVTSRSPLDLADFLEAIAGHQAAVAAR